MKKMLLGLAAVFALTTATPAFAGDAPKDDAAAPAPKKGKKGKKPKKDKDAAPPADATK